MSETFRSKVDRICSELAGEIPCTVAPCPFGGEEQHSMSEAECAKCAVDRILAAYKAKVEGMPEPECLKVGDKGLNNLVFLGAKEHHLACKSYLMGEIDSAMKEMGK